MTTLLIFHGLVSVALLGALTHQVVSLLRVSAYAGADQPARGTSFAARYSRVSPVGFSTTVVVLYVIAVALGAIIYPKYRLDVRVPFEEMGLFWAVGLFEIKEHWGGVGLGVLPLYAYCFRPENTTTHGMDRLGVATLLALIVWSDFIVGHVLNNIRGFF